MQLCMCISNCIMILKTYFISASHWKIIYHQKVHKCTTHWSSKNRWSCITRAGIRGRHISHETPALHTALCRHCPAHSWLLCPLHGEGFAGLLFRWMDCSEGALCLASFTQHNFCCCILLMLLHFKLLCRISLWESHGLLAHCIGDGHLGWSPSLSCCHSVAKSCPLFVTPWSATCQASLSFTISQNFLKLMSIYSCPSPSLWVTANAHFWIPR